MSPLNNETNETNETNKVNRQTNLPVVTNEDVEYSSELADAEDREAVERANEADSRQKEL